jgi:hypothetical protein
MRSFQPGTLLFLLSGFLLFPVAAAGQRSPQPGSSAEQDPPELRRQIRELRESPDVAHAALRAEALRTGDPVSRARLLDVLEDPGVPIHVMDGILISLLEKNDRADGVTGRLFTIYARAQGLRKERLRDAIRRYDARGPMLSEPLAIILSGEGNGGRRDIIEMAVLLADTDEERRDVVRTLVILFEREKTGPLAEAAREGLFELTWQEWKTPEEWSSWFGRFLSENPNGFSQKALALEAVRQARAGAGRRATEEARRGIQLLVGARILPSDYLDLARTPDPEVRAFAAQRMAAAVAQVAELGPAAVAALAPAVTDPEPIVQQEALRALGALAQGDPKLGPRVAEAARRGLTLPNLKSVDLAVQALRLARVPETGDGLHDLFVALRRSMDPEAAAIRRGIISALAALRVHEEVILDALTDADAGVQVTAANALALAPTPAAARRIAECLPREKDASVRQGFARALAQIRRFEDPAIVTALTGQLGPETEPQVTRAVIDALLVALSLGGDGAPAEATAAEVERALRSVWPERAGDKSARIAAASRLQELAAGEGPAIARLRALLRAWVLVEPESEVRQALVTAFLRSRPRDPAEVLAFAVEARARGFMGSVELLVRGLAAGAGESPDLSPAAQAQARRLLAEAWVQIGVRPDAVEHARGLLAADAAAAPEDGVLLALHGRLLLRAGESAAAARFLALALERAPADLDAATRREWTFERGRALAESASSSEVLKVLDGPEFLKERAVRLLRATALARDHFHGEAFTEAEHALALPAPPADEDVLQLLLSFGIRAADADVRRRAHGILTRLEAQPGTETLIREAREAMAQDEETRRLLALLVPSTPAPAREAALQGLRAQDPIRFGTWAIEFLSSPDLSPAALLDIARILKAQDPGDAVLQALDLPPELPPEALAGMVELLTTWWQERTHRRP